ncbi:MAG: phosphopyruvate hydratase [Candidatus Moraniibacteriota bacterium]|nr:MAG: phosphopyruvate hydratase [Candidatus Moranbacteria bacterium]
MSKIKKVYAREILDSRGNPTVETEVWLDDDTKAWAQVPSGASTGEFEALELRDGDKDRYGGKGVLKAVENVVGEIADAVIGMDSAAQEELDKKMIELDGTENKERLGANAILSVSLAACRASAISKKKALYEHIAELHGNKKVSLPIPMFNIINGGMHADSGLAIQEYKIVPHGVESFKEQYRAGSEIFHALKKYFGENQLGTSVGDEGGFAPRLENNLAPLEAIKLATEKAGYAMGEQVNIAIDAAANSFYHEKCGHYAFALENRAMTTLELLDEYDKWVNNHYVMSIEDGLTEYDWDGWSVMYEKFNEKIMLIGDDLIVTNAQRLQKAIDEKACNSVLIKPNQIGTLTETLACIKLAQDNSMKTVISHRSGETIDDFIADLSVGVGSEYIKTGSLSRGERMCKYNRLLTISEQL